MNKETPQDRIDKLKAANGVFFFEPYPWQERALKMIRVKNTTAIISSNKIGKCLTYDTLIDTPSGEVSVGELFKKGKSFDVFSWDGEKKVITKAQAPFKKQGLHKCYRITMSDGRWIDSADNHRILNVDGHYVSTEDLFYTYSQSLLSSSLGNDLSVHAVDGLHLTRIKSNYQDDCLEDLYQDGEQPLLFQDNDQVFLPSQDDFQAHNDLSSYKGGQMHKHKYILQHFFDLLCKGLQLLGQTFEFLSQIGYNSFGQLIYGHPNSQLFQLAATSGFQSYPEVYPQYHDTLPSYVSPLPLMIDGNKIESINLISGSQEVYDFTVKKYHNYFAGGLIHHNTALVINIIISWLLGYEPWQVVEKDASDGIEVAGVWYRKSSLGIDPTVNLILTGEDWKTHIGKVLVPELKKWSPEGWYKTKKNEQGVEYYWEFCDKDGKWDKPSTLTLMSYSQADALFESFRVQGVIEDEPPPKSKHKAMSRGLLLDNGKTLMSLTPIKEAWILDDIVLSGRKDVGIVDGLKITDNPDLYESDKNVLRPYLDGNQIDQYFKLLLYDNFDKKTPVSDQGKSAEIYLETVIPEKYQQDISKLKILKFIKDIDPDDVPPRVFGQFKSLVGRVLKEFDTDLHIIEPFDVPTDWPVTVLIDFHLSTPQAISYWTVNKQDINYCVKEVWKNYSADEVADNIIRSKKGGLSIEDVYIDPLAKGDVSYLKNRFGSNLRDTYSIIEEKISLHGMTLHVASKDKDSGVKNLKTMLKGVNGLPILYIFDTCERFLYEVQRWVFDENGKPSKDCSDHFMENAYRFTLVGLRYQDHVINPLPQTQQTGTHGWLGA